VSRKLKLLLAVCLVVLLIGGIVAVRRKKSDPLANLVPYATSDKLMYFDLSTMFPGGVPKGASTAGIEPMAIRTMELKKVDFKTIENLIHKAMPEKDGWNYFPQPAPGKGVALDFQSINAFKGAKPTGAMGEPDDMIVLMPDAFTNMTMPSSPTAIPEPPKVDGYRFMEMRKMSRWEVWWLKLTHLGKNPYSTPEDMFGP
jgi:hypothetical protein